MVINDKLENLEEDMDRLIDAMLPFPSLDVDQFEQVKRHAMERRELIYRLTFLPASEFVSLSSLASDDKSNLDRAVARLLQNSNLLRVRIDGDWCFPIVQINPNTNEPYTELQLVMECARSRGYTDWEILSWLIRPKSPADSTPGELPTLKSRKVTPQALVDGIKAKHASLVFELPIAPITLLSRGEVYQFQQHAIEWLGPSANLS